MVKYNPTSETKRFIENINEKAVFTYIPWNNKKDHDTNPWGVKCFELDYNYQYDKTDDYKNFIKNVVDGYIFMPHTFLYCQSHSSERKKLFENTNVYHIVLNNNDVVTIFCKKGKTKDIELSFEQKPKFKINISLNKSNIINFHRYSGLLNDSIISIEKKNNSKWEKFLNIDFTYNIINHAKHNGSSNMFYDFAMKIKNAI